MMIFIMFSFSLYEHIFHNHADEPKGLMLNKQQQICPHIKIITQLNDYI